MHHSTCFKYIIARSGSNSVSFMLYTEIYFHDYCLHAFFWDNVKVQSLTSNYLTKPLYSNVATKWEYIKSENFLFDSRSKCL